MVVGVVKRVFDLLVIVLGGLDILGFGFVKVFLVGVGFGLIVGVILFGVGFFLGVFQVKFFEFVSCVFSFVLKLLSGFLLS